MASKKVAIYTDGACIGNPGPGGYAAILVSGGHRKEISGGFRFTTSNRMELKAAIAGLTALRSECMVDLYTDSRYVARTMSCGWAAGWRAHGWKRRGGARALNADLWDQLLRLCVRHHVTCQWIRGHHGQFENERCDFLSREAASKADLPPDEVYEATSRKS